MIIKPVLMINGRKASLNLMKNTLVKVSMDNKNYRSTVLKTYDNLIFDENKETVISFIAKPCTIIKVSIET